MPARIWGPLTVMGIYTIAGAVIGADIALWPWEEAMSFSIPVTIGVIGGFLTGVFIVWAVRQTEELG